MREKMEFNKILILGILLVLAGADFSIVATGGVKTNFTNITGTYIVHTFNANSTFTVLDATGTISILIVGAGAGGGGSQAANVGAGGGGAGEYYFNDSVSVVAIPYSIVVGTKGDGGPAGNNNGNPGQDSSALGFTCKGGGYGAGFTGTNGGNGGSGGGASNNGAGGTTTKTIGHGNNGGSDVTGGLAGGGGGGAGSGGGNSAALNAGNGGNGIESAITGTAKNYSCGGGGGIDVGTAGTAVPLCGGAGGKDAAGSDAAANTGSGGGGAGTVGVNHAGGNGSDGVVIISYLYSPMTGCPATNLTSPANNSLLTNTTVVHKWVDMAAYSADYIFCFNSSANIAQVCYYGITNPNLTISVPNGSVVEWAVYSNCSAGANFSANSSVFLYRIGTNSTIPPLSNINTDIESLMYSYWVQWGKWVLLVVACGLSYMMLDKYGNMALAAGIASISIAFIWLAFLPALDLVIGSIGIMLIVIGFTLKALNR